MRAPSTYMEMPFAPYDTAMLRTLSAVAELLV